MLGATLPSYSTDKDNNDKNDDKEAINADDPANRQKVKEFFDSIK